MCLAWHLRSKLAEFEPLADVHPRAFPIAQTSRLALVVAHRLSSTPALAPSWGSATLGTTFRLAPRLIPAASCFLRLILSPRRLLLRQAEPRSPSPSPKRLLVPLQICSAALTLLSGASTRFGMLAGESVTGRLRMPAPTASPP